MQTANCSLALGGDQGNTVPKFGITAAEIAVLRVIHGDDAVTNIEPAGEVKRTDRQEIARLTQVFGTNQDGRVRAKAVEALFPGAAARVFHTLDELDLPEELFAAERRMGGRPIAEREEDSVEAEVAARQATAEVAPAVEAPAVEMPAVDEPATEQAEEIEEGIGEDMTDLPDETKEVFG